MIEKKAVKRPKTEKGWIPTTLARKIEFERFLKPFKGGSVPPRGGDFAGFAGGAAHA